MAITAPTPMIAGANTDHGDHRPYADDDAQHGERGARAVHGQRPQRDPDACDELIHADSNSSGCSAGSCSRSFSASRGCATRSSPCNLPSLKLMFRLEKLAMSGSCVTMIMVIPSWRFSR